jgi:hypothetical protein
LNDHVNVRVSESVFRDIAGYFDFLLNIEGGCTVVCQTGNTEDDRH